MRLKPAIMPLTMTLLLSVGAPGQQREEKLPSRANLYEPLILDAAARHQVDPRLLWTIAYLESRFQPRVVSYKDGRPCAYGLMQFIPATAQRYGLKDPLNPTEALAAAARYVRDLQDRFAGRGELMLAAYNAGEGTVEAFRDGKRLVLPNGKVINPNGIRTGGIPPYRETRAYVALGKAIYEQISRAGLLQPHATRLSGNAPTPAVQHKELPKQDSLYILELGVQGREAPGKPSKIKAFQQQSLYPN